MKAMILLDSKNMRMDTKYYVVSQSKYSQMEKLTKNTTPLKWKQIVMLIQLHSQMIS
jgi:hypothetical protein